MLAIFAGAAAQHTEAFFVAALVETGVGWHEKDIFVVLEDTLIFRKSWKLYQIKALIPCALEHLPPVLATHIIYREKRQVLNKLPLFLPRFLYHIFTQIRINCLLFTQFISLVHINFVPSNPTKYHHAMPTSDH